MQITQKKKNFLRLIQKEKMLFDDLPDNSLLLEESVYLEYLNLNTVNKKNLKESADLILTTPAVSRSEKKNVYF